MVSACPALVVIPASIDESTIEDFDAAVASLEAPGSWSSPVPGYVQTEPRECGWLRDAMAAGGAPEQVTGAADVPALPTETP